MSNFNIFTIGFTKKSAESFFSTLSAAKIKYLIDVRLNNESQLSGFSKKDDLRFFLKRICGCEYEHKPNWAPTSDLLDKYKKKEISWSEYENRFFGLISERRIEEGISLSKVDHACLLCSEPKAAYCHRRIVAEYLKQKIPQVKIIHL